MVDYLDPEIANEGVSAEGAWQPVIEEARVPDYRGIKAIRKYFPQYTGRPYAHQVFPCWLYHPTKPAKLVRDILTGEDPPRILKKASEVAAELGCIYRSSTLNEKAMGFPPMRWEYTSEWRATPFETKFDPSKPETGKHVILPNQANQGPSADVIAGVVAAVMAKMSPAAAPSPSDQEWAEFQAFKAFKDSKIVAAPVIVESQNPLAATAEDDDDRPFWIEMAKEKNLKVDGRWSTIRLREEVEKIA